MEALNHIIREPGAWVGIGFLIFLAIAARYVFPKLGGALDDYGSKISKEIEEAKALKEEAAELLREAKKKSSAAERSANEIVERAKFEAKLIADEAEKEIEREIERKLALAEEKIARAQDAAVENIRKKAVENAIDSAAETLRKEFQTAKSSEKLVDKSLRLISNDIS